MSDPTESTSLRAGASGYGAGGSAVLAVDDMSYHECVKVLPGPVAARDAPAQ